MDYKAQFNVKLGKYKGLEYPSFNTEASDSAIEAFLEQQAQRFKSSMSVDRCAELGDTVVIDFAGFLGDEQFEGGTSENYPLELGSHTFIPGFEEQLVGTKAGDEKDVNVTFPENYQAADLAGKPVVFKCKIHDVQRSETPKIDDDFAKRFNMANLEELKAAAAQTIKAQNEERYNNMKQQIIITQVIENSDISISDEYMNDCIDQMVNYLRKQVTRQGITLEQYCEYNGVTMEELRKQVTPQTENSAKSTAVLSAIADAENVEISEEELDAELAQMAKNYNMTIEELKAGIQSDSIEGIKLGLAATKALDLLLSFSVEKK